MRHPAHPLLAPGTLFQKGQGRMLRLVSSRSISSSALRLLQLWWHRGGREVAKWRSIKVTVAHCSCCCDGFGAGACDPTLKSWSSPRSCCPLLPPEHPPAAWKPLGALRPACRLCLRADCAFCRLGEGLPKEGGDNLLRF